LAPEAVAAIIAGHASVNDGDTIETQGERIRILDIDPSEGKRACTKPDPNFRWGKILVAGRAYLVPDQARLKPIEER
jgi:endonuclease YncB( thermonuclease family)